MTSAFNTLRSKFESRTRQITNYHSLFQFLRGLIFDLISQLQSSALHNSILPCHHDGEFSVPERKVNMFTKSSCLRSTCSCLCYWKTSRKSNSYLPRFQKKRTPLLFLALLLFAVFENFFFLRLNFIFIKQARLILTL